MSSIWSPSREARSDIAALNRHLRPRRFFGPDASAAGIIAQLAKRDEPGAIPTIANALFSSNKEIHNAAASAIAHLLPLVPSLDLIRLANVLGSVYFDYVAFHWNELLPATAESYLAKTRNVAVGNLLSLHKNGYVRHVATRFLAEVETGEELRFLLIRTNDWVHAISTDAQASVSEKSKKPDYSRHFVEQTDLIFHLRIYKRRELGDSVLQYVDLLVQPECRRELQNAIVSCDKQTRRSLINDLLERDGEHRAETIRIGLESSDPIVRLRCLKRAKGILSDEESNELADKMMNAKFGPIREEAYELKASLSENPDNVWKDGLFDKCRSIRESATFYLKKANIDVAAIGRDELTRRPDSFPALSVLAASGDASDLRVFSKFLDLSLIHI